MFKIIGPTLIILCTTMALPKAAAASCLPGAASEESIQTLPSRTHYQAISKALRQWGATKEETLSTLTTLQRADSTPEIVKDYIRMCLASFLYQEGALPPPFKRETTPLEKQSAILEAIEDFVAKHVTAPTIRKSTFNVITTIRTLLFASTAHTITQYEPSSATQHLLNLIETIREFIIHIKTDVLEGCGVSSHTYLSTIHDLNRSFDETLGQQIIFCSVGQTPPNTSSFFEQVTSSLEVFHLASIPQHHYMLDRRDALYEASLAALTAAQADPLTHYEITLTQAASIQFSRSLSQIKTTTSLENLELDALKRALSLPIEALCSSLHTSITG
jgi:hypothetical protein